MICFYLKCDASVRNYCADSVLQWRSMMKIKHGDLYINYAFWSFGSSVNTSLIRSKNCNNNLAFYFNLGILIFIFNFNFFLLQDTEDIYSQSYIPGTLTKHKFETLGTRDAVKDTRQNYLTNQKKEQGKWHEIFTRSHARM